MEKLDCMFVHQSKFLDPILAASSPATKTIYVIFTMVSKETILHKRDALVANLQMQIATQR